MIKREYIVSAILLILLAIVQSTLLHYIAIMGVKPDILLVALVFIAIRRGSMTGQISGFIGGLAEDVISIAPLGFNALIKTVTGFLYGIMEDKIVMDPIIFPFILVAIATFIKYIFITIIAALFSLKGNYGLIFSKIFIVELIYNSFSAPFIFALLSLIKSLKQRERTIV